MCERVTDPTLETDGFNRTLHLASPQPGIKRMVATDRARLAFGRRLEQRYVGMDPSHEVPRRSQRSPASND